MPPAAAAAAPPRALAAFGRYDLRALGYGPLDVPTRGASPTAASIAYRIVDPRQRPGHQYLLRLHFRLALAPDSGPGRAYVSAVSGGFASAQVKVTVERRGAALRVRWSTIGLVGGAVVRETASRLVEVRFANYTAYAGVARGVNRLAFRLERYGDVRVASLRILPDTAIELTRVSPARLTIAVAASRRSVPAGSPVVVTVRLRNAGGLTARQIRIRALPFGSGLELAGAADRPVRDLPPGAQLFESFRFTPREPGRYPIFFSVSSSSNRPGTGVEIVATGAARKAASRSSGPGLGVTLGIAFGAAALAALALLQLRRGRPRRGGPR